METKVGPRRSGDSSPRVNQKPPVPKKPILPSSTRQQKGIIKARQEPIVSPIAKPPVPPPKPNTSPQSTRRPLTSPKGKSVDSSQEEDIPPATPPRSVSLENDTKEDLRGRIYSQPIRNPKVPSKLLQSISLDNGASTNRHPSQPVQEEDVPPTKPPRSVSLDNEDLKGRHPSQPGREKEFPKMVPVKSVSFDNDATTDMKGRHPPQPIQEEEFPPKVAAKPLRSVNDATTNLSPLFPRKATIKVSHSEGIPLTDLFTEQYFNKLPLRIIILEGYRGTMPELCISTSDVYNIHFMKHRSVVCIKDSMGQIYSVPINSSVQFGLVYNPDKRSTAYSTFVNVADILAQKTLPKIVCVTQTFDGASNKSVVQKNELLVILKAHRSKMRRKGLEVHSLLTKSNKFLTGDCKGHFTTDPAKTRLHLPTIVDHIRDPFPNVVVLFPSKSFSSSTQDMSSSLFTGPVTMLYAKKEASLVATAVIDELASEDNPLLDFPHDDCLSVVQVAILQVDDCESLYENTQSLYQNFDLSKLKSCKDTGSRETYDNQELFYTDYQEGFEKYGVELHVSHGRYAEVQTHRGIDTVTTSESGDSDNYEEIVDSDNSDYESIKDTSKSSDTAKSSDHSVIPPPFPNLKPPIGSTHSLPAPLSKAPVAIPSDADDCEYDIPDVTRRHVDMPPTSPKQASSLPSPTNAPHNALVRTQSDYYYARSARKSSPVERSAILAELKELRSDITQLSSGLERLEKYIGSSQLDITHLSSQVEQLEKYIGSSQLDITQLSSKVEQLEEYSGSSQPAAVVVSPGHAHSNEEKNGNHLRALTLEQVQEMLDKMSLAQYKDIFAREQITGDVLSELSEEDLQHELGITSRIHRIRLMKVITD